MWVEDPYDGSYVWRNQPQQGPYNAGQQQSGAEQGANAAGSIAGMYAGKKAAGWVAAKLAGSAVAKGTTAAVAAPKIISVTAAPAASSTIGGTAATTGMSAGMSAGAIGAGVVGGAGLAYGLHHAMKGRADRGAAGGIVGGAGFGMMVGGPVGAAIGAVIGGLAGGIGGAVNRQTTKDRQKERTNRLIAQNILGIREMKNSGELAQKAGDVNRVEKSLAQDFVGYTPSDSRPDQMLWINNKFRNSRDVADLMPEDIMGQHVMFETFGNDWIGGLSHQGRRMVAEKALADGQIREGRGMIDFKDKDYADKLRAYAEELRNGNPSLADPQNVEGNPAAAHAAEYQASQPQQPDSGIPSVDYMQWLNPSQQEAFRKHLAMIESSRLMG